MVREEGFGGAAAGARMGFSKRGYARLRFNIHRCNSRCPAAKLGADILGAPWF